MVFGEFKLQVEYRETKLALICQHYHFFSNYHQIWVHVDTGGIKPIRAEKEISYPKPDCRVYLYYIINYEKRELLSYELERCNPQSKRNYFRGLAEIIEEAILKKWNDIESLKKFTLTPPQPNRNK